MRVVRHVCVLVLVHDRMLTYDSYLQISIISTWLKSFPLDFVANRTHLQMLLKQWIRDAETKPFGE